MRILIGQITHGITEGIILGEKQGKLQIKSVYGLETPPIRNNANNWSGNDGGYMSSQLYGARTITINGFYMDESAFCEGVETVRQKLIKNLRIRKNYPLFFELGNKEIFSTSGFLFDFKMDFTSYNYGEFMITFYCPDEGLYIAEQFGDVDSITKRKRINKEKGGGHLVPENLPVLFEEGRSQSVIYNKGTENYYPIFELLGPFTNYITITNQTTNQSFTIDRTIVENEVITIDMKNKEVMSGGVSVAYDIGVDSEWIYLEPGLNRIIFESDDETDTQYIDIVWRNGVEGI